MQTTCPMANKPKFSNLHFTIATVLVLSCISVLTDARILAENVDSSIHPKEIFILAGQSNMAGRGALKWDSSVGENGSNVFLPDQVPVEDTPDPERIFRLNAELGWEVAKDPLHVDIDHKPAGVGPGMSFANAIKGRLGSTIGLVPCAVGETSISMWQRGGELYNNMAKRVKVAMQDGGELKALLWYQGEYDSLTQDLVDSYKSKVETLFQNVREDLNSPSLPIIQVAIGTGANYGTENITLIESLRTIQKSINLPNLVIIDAKGLPHGGKPDGVHLTAVGQVTLGHMLAEAYIDNFLSPAPSP